MEDIKIIEINWEGPFTEEEIETKHNAGDYGLYQVYGNHEIYGKDVLLYIGKAASQTFGTRLPQHDDWYGWKEIEMKYYLGKFGGTENTTSNDWDDQINFAESGLIIYCQPSYNSSGLNSSNRFSKYNKVIIFNYGLRRSLPFVMNDESNTNNSDLPIDWKEYSSETVLR